MAGEKSKADKAGASSDESRPPTLDGDFVSGVREGQNVFVVDPAAQARQQHAAEARYLARHPLDRAKRSGGYYINADGQGAHDANGNPVPLLPEDQAAAEQVKALAEARKRAVEANAPGAGDSPEEMAAAGVKGD